MTADTASPDAPHRCPRCGRDFDHASALGQHVRRCNAMPDTASPDALVALREAADAIHNLPHGARCLWNKGAEDCSCSKVTGLAAIERLRTALAASLPAPGLAAALRATPAPGAGGLDDAPSRLLAWAQCVQRLMAIAPLAAVIDETGIEDTGHATPPDRKALRERSRAVVAGWLERDLAALAPRGVPGTGEAGG